MTVAAIRIRPILWYLGICDQDPGLGGHCRGRRFGTWLPFFFLFFWLYARVPFPCEYVLRKDRGGYACVRRLYRTRCAT